MNEKETVYGSRAYKMYDPAEKTRKNPEFSSNVMYLKLKIQQES